MHATHFAPNGDLPTWVPWLACGLVLVSLAFLAVEMRRRERGGGAIFLTGVLGLAALLAAILRPVQIASKDSVVGARVFVLADTSRSMALPSDHGGTRREARDAAIAAIEKRAPGARVVTLGFGEGGASPFTVDTQDPDRTARSRRSDLTAALTAIANAPEERPSAIVVISDGRLDDPPEDASDDALRAAAGLSAPIHTIATSGSAPADASIRKVAAAGAAVAHVPMPLRVEVGCSGGLTCDKLTVVARELREGEPPALLASGLADVKNGKGTVDLTITLENYGPRIVEVAITPPDGDTIRENDRRLITFNVARERIRILHVAGRPTNDVRALRQWLKSDASVDVVAFFILRTPADDPEAPASDLALIPFPVDELFTEHLRSFDAVILQDFDAVTYKLALHLPELANYVRGGGGLIMVGGPTAFIAGGYAGSPLANVLPTALDPSPGATPADATPFVPSWTDLGRNAPMLGPLRGVVSEELPTMPGANVLGDPRPGTMVLWEHPTRKTKSGAPMPVLAMGYQGNGRSIALAVDGAWQLEFSELGARTAGRGYGAMWDGLLGWLMRDPRFEPAQIDLADGCIAKVPAKIRVRAASSALAKSAAIEVVRLDKDEPALKIETPLDATGTADVSLPALEAGGYAARVRVGNTPPTSREFACEAGGDEWADSRPDPDRLRAIGRATRGTFSWAWDTAPLPLPPPTVVSAEKHVVPVIPAWAWTLACAALLGAHWLVRRRSGLT